MIAAFLYNRPRVLALILFAIVAWGGSCLWVMPRLEDPVLGSRVAVITTAYPGADARQVESLVTIPIEQRLAGIADVKQIRSNCQAGVSNVVIELKDDVRDIDAVWSKVRDQVSDIKNDLPAAVLPAKLDIFRMKAYAAIVSIQNANDRTDMSVLRRVGQQFQSSVLTIQGTDAVDVFGDPGEQLSVRVTPERLVATGLTTRAIAQQIQQQMTAFPGGRLPVDTQPIAVGRRQAWLPLDRLSRVLIASEGPGTASQLSDIANVSRTEIQPLNNLALIDGQRSIVLGVVVDDRQQVDAWTRHLQQHVGQLNERLAGTVEAKCIFLQSQHINRRMFSLIANLSIGTIAVVLIVFLLMGWRSMIVVGVALPLSALMVIGGMRVLGVPIHQMSVTGLIVALGLLIDNAIVVVDEVRGRNLIGLSPVQAISKTIGHLRNPLLGSTITTILAFLPIAMLPGPAGEFVGSIAISVILAISSSFLLAMTVIPALHALLNIRPPGTGLLAGGIKLKKLRDGFESMLRTFFSRPWLAIVVCAIIPVFGFYIAGQLPRQFFPATDRNQIQIEIELAQASSIAAVQKTVSRVRSIVQANRHVQHQHWFLGGSAPTFYYNVVPRRRGTPFYAQAMVDVQPQANNQKLVRQLQTAIDAVVLNSRVVVRELQQGPPFDAPIELRIAGPDLQTLRELGDELRRLLIRIPGVLHTRSDMAETVPQLTLDLDSVGVKQMRLSDADITGQLFSLLEGADAGTVFDGGESLPIKVKLDFGDDSKVDTLAALPLRWPQRTRPSQNSPSPTAAPMTGQSVLPVASLADIQLEADVATVLRIDGRRVNEVKAYLQPGLLPATVMGDLQQRLDQSGFVLPTGYRLHLGGEPERRSSAINSLMANVVVICVLMVLSLVASCGSFRCALIVAVVGIMSIGLAPVTLLVSGLPLGFMAIVGTMGLVGIAINDSIVVLAAIGASPESRAGQVDSMVTVVSGCTRHIVATTLTTIVGFTPLVVNGGDFWPPLAITIAGGVAGATLFALFFAPSLYRLLKSS